jgi:hypothetical protein
MEELTRRYSEKPPVPSAVSPQELLRLSGSQALKAILDSPTPAHLVQSVAEEDLFWLVREIGPEDALPILSLASNDQWQFLLDLEVWHKDRLDMGSLNRWLELLLKAHPERLLIWGLREQIGLFEFHLFKNIEVKIRQEDESPSDFDESYFTLDGVFYVRIIDEQQEQTIRELLERFAAFDYKKFQQILLELPSLLPAEAEESVYRLRNVRLAEKGFLPFEEAVGIYQHMSPNRLPGTAPEVQKTLRGQPPGDAAPLLPSLLIQDTSFFAISLRHVEAHQILDRVQMEFAGMCNQIISADGFTVTDKDDLAAIVRKACGYLDVGLEKLDGRDPAKGARLIEKYALQEIFRVGYGAALELKWKTEKWVKASWFVTQGFSPAFWGTDLEGMLEGLLRKRPLYYAGLGEASLHREFKSLEEIARFHSMLDEIMALDRLLSLLFIENVPHPVQTYQPLTYKSLCITPWARHHLNLSEEVEPLLASQLKNFFRNLWTRGKKPFRVEQKMKQSFSNWLARRSGLTAGEIENQVGKSLDNLLAEIESEYGSISIEDLDPRYVKHFLVTS